MDHGPWSKPDLCLCKEQYTGGQEYQLAGGRVKGELGFCSWFLSAVRADQYDVRVATVTRRAGAS